MIKHPKTGEEILYICEAGTETIEDGAGRIQDAALLQQLLEASGQLDPDYASPFIHAQHYEVGDIVLWDNRSLVHRAKHGTRPDCRRRAWCRCPRPCSAESSNRIRTKVVAT
ncbi:Putative dioxygenase [Mycobacteroides abscessus subsp. abscessus]|nr:Putative dioxygenase [Mycobacteroides abscessus subsp. abscessus]